MSRSILCVTPDCYLDFANGAAVSLRDLLQLLAARDWKCDVLCGSAPAGGAIAFARMLQTPGIEVSTQRRDATPSGFDVHTVGDHGITARIYAPSRWSRPPTLDEGYPFLQLLDKRLQFERPDVIVTFCGGWLGRGIMAVARRHGIPVVFWLRNTDFEHRDLFETIAGAIVPSEFMARHFSAAMGLACKAIYPPIRPERVVCKDRKPEYVTFVSPQPDKGVFFFARIASELIRLRPDIRILVVEGRGVARSLEFMGLGLNDAKLRIMPPTRDPRVFLRVTRAIVAPSLWQEAFMRIGAEAMLNGIPTLSSRRGGIPEMLGNSGFLFDIAQDYTPSSRTPPPAADVAPWLEILTRLWDDATFYSEQQQKCFRESTRFDIEQNVSQHADYLSEVAQRPALPSFLSIDLAASLADLNRFFPSPMQLKQFGPVEWD